MMNFKIIIMIIEIIIIIVDIIKIIIIIKEYINRVFVKRLQLVKYIISWY